MSAGTAPLVVAYSTPRPKPKGLDWSKVSPPVDESETVTVEVGHCNVCGTTGVGVKNPCTVCRDRETALRESTHRVSVPEPTTVVVDDEHAPADVDVPAMPADVEVQAVVETLQQTAGSTDMVVAACRAAVVAAADALRGAHLRAIEPGGRARRTSKPAQKRERRPKETPPIEVQKPHVLETVRSQYLDELRSVDAIAKDLGMSPTTVKNVMRRNGIVARDGKSNNRAAREQLKARLVALGVTSQQVREWAARAGVSVPARGMVPTAVLDAFEEAKR